MSLFLLWSVFLASKLGDPLEDVIGCDLARVIMVAKDVAIDPNERWPIGGLTHLWPV